MGITNCHKLFEKINLCGVYNGRLASAKRVNLYVDGENLRFKGMSSDNTNSDNAELHIARDSFNYMDRVRQRLARHLFGKHYLDSTGSDLATTKTSGAWRKHRDFDKVYVFMDGQRPHNKVTRSHRSQVDHSLIRSSMMAMCRARPSVYEVVELRYGESELLMYLYRDQSADLNVFLTTDSDCLSVMYGHCPTIDYYPGGYIRDSTLSSSSSSSSSSCRADGYVPECICHSSEREYFDRLEQQFGTHGIPNSLLLNTTRDFSLMRLVDFNDVYAIENSNVAAVAENKSPSEPRIRAVRDSCVFAHINQRSLYLYGMDFLQQRQIKLPPKVFRIFCALSGTDFTRPLLSATLMANFIRNVTLPPETMTRVQRDLKFLESTEATLGDTSLCIMFVLLAALHCADINKCQLPKRLKSLSSRTLGKIGCNNYEPTGNDSGGDDDDIAILDYYAQVIGAKSYDILLDELTLACDVYLEYITSGKMPDITIPSVCSAGEYLHKIINGMCTEFTPMYYQRFHPTHKTTISSLDKLKDMCQWLKACPNLLTLYYEKKVAASRNELPSSRGISKTRDSVTIDLATRSDNSNGVKEDYVVKKDEIRKFPPEVADMEYPMPVTDEITQYNTVNLFDTNNGDDAIMKLCYNTDYNETDCVGL